MNIMFSIPPPSLLNAKACISRNWDTIAHIKFIFDTDIDDPEWQNPIYFAKIE